MTDLAATDRAVRVEPAVGDLVCVVGMHRSGTSLVTRILNLLGVGLGPDDLLMPPDDRANPTGYWENEAVVRLNDRILNLLGGSWDNPPPLAAGWESDPALDPLRAEASSVTATIATGSALTAFKDPRASLLLPFWASVTPVAGSIVMVRHPFHVAASLGVRDGMHPEDAARLWTRYTVDAWRHHPERIVVNFDAALQDPVLCALHLANFLGLDLPSGETLGAIRAFANPALSHHGDSVFPVGPHMALALAVFAVIESQPAPLVDRIFAAIAQEWTPDS